MRKPEKVKVGPLISEVVCDMSLIKPGATNRSGPTQGRARRLWLSTDVSFRGQQRNQDAESAPKRLKLEKTHDT